MEVGVHNGMLAVTIASSPLLLNSAAMAMPPAIYSIIMFFTAAGFSGVMSRVSDSVEEAEAEASRVVFTPVEPVIGIDLGTTYSAWPPSIKAVRSHPLAHRTRLTPSIVGFTAMESASSASRRACSETRRPTASRRHQALHRPPLTPELAAAAKGVVPYPLSAGPNGEIRIKLAGKMLPITQVSAMILGELKLDAETHFAGR